MDRTLGDLKGLLERAAEVFLIFFQNGLFHPLHQCNEQCSHTKYGNGEYVLETSSTDEKHPVHYSFKMCNPQRQRCFVQLWKNTDKLY